MNQPPTHNAPPAVPAVHCLGCGRAARTLLRLWHEHGLIRVGAVVNRSRASAQAAVAFIGAGEACGSMPVMAAHDGLLLGVAESQLAAVAQALAQQLRREGGGPGFAFHLSASQPGAVLDGLAPRLASCHPALAFAQPVRALEQFAGSWCVVEGEPVLAAQLQHWCQAAGARVMVAEQLDKRLYHAAAMTASNLMLGVLGLSQRLAAAAGLPSVQANQLLTELALRNLHAAQPQGPAQAFTGPLERGDSATIAALLHHVRTTPGVSTDDAAAWACLLRQCLALVREKKCLEAEVLAAVEAVVTREF